MGEKHQVPNSHRYRAENKASQPADNERKLEKVAKGRVSDKKRGERQGVLYEIGHYLLHDIAIPAVKDFLWDGVSSSLSMFLYGDTKRGQRNRPSASRVSYSSYYDDPRDSRRHDAAPKTRRGFEYDDIIFDSKGDAEVVLDRMCETIETYGFVTILDLYDLADLSAPTHTSNRYGWTNLRSAETVRVRDGYILKLPRAQVID